MESTQQQEPAAPATQQLVAGNNGEGPRRFAELKVTHGASFNGFESPQNFAALHHMAKALAQSSMVPVEYQSEHLRGDKWIENPVAVGNCIIAIEVANRLRLPVPMVMQGLDVIHGRPAWRGAFLSGLIDGSGWFSPIDYEWCGEAGKDTWGCRVVVVDLRPGANGKERFGPWCTIDIAKKEGWYGRKGSKWPNLPELMLMYRAVAFFSRVHAGALLLGFGTAEEYEDVYDVQPDGSVRQGRARVSGGRSLNDELAQEAGSDEPSDAEKARDAAKAEAGKRSPRARKGATSAPVAATGETPPAEDAPPAGKPPTQTVGPVSVGDTATVADAVIDAITSDDPPFDPDPAADAPASTAAPSAADKAAAELSDLFKQNSDDADAFNVE